MDPEGQTTKEALADLKYRVEDVSTAKVYEIDLDASSLEEAEEKVDEMSRKLLANPVKDDYEIEVREVR